MVGLEGLQNIPIPKEAFRDLTFVSQLAVSLAKPTVEFVTSSTDFVLCIYSDFTLLNTILQHFNYPSTLNIEEVMKFYNPGKKPFETDFNVQLNFESNSKNARSFYY